MSLNRMLLVAAVLFGSVAVALTATRASTESPTPEEISAGIMVFKAAGLGDTFDKVLPLVSEQIQNRLLQQRPDLRVEVPQTVNEVAIKLIPRRRDLDSAAGRIWAQSFTLDEMKAIAAFYRSPAGQKYLDLGPKAVEDSSIAMQKWSQRLSDEMYDQSLAALKAKGIDF
jgi:hypothetical protein